LATVAKEAKKKVKANAPSSPKYVTSDEDTLSSDDDDSLPSEFEVLWWKGLWSKLGLGMSFLSLIKSLLKEEHKKLLALEKSKVAKLDQELAQRKETTCSLKSLIDALQGQHDVL
jgi:hypothetical protein